MVILDTDIFILEFRFQRDHRYSINKQFLSTIKATGGAITIYSAMEFLGKMSFNVNPNRLMNWRSWLQDAYNLTIIWPDAGDIDADSFIYSFLFNRPFERMCRTPIAFVDSLILDLVEQVEEAQAFITWNAKHFMGKTFLAVKTPQEYLASM
jgi:hypothetical protein